MKKVHHHTQIITSSALTLLAGVCVLFPGPRAEAASKKAPVFSEMPGVTTPLPDPAATEATTMSEPAPVAQATEANPDAPAPAGQTPASNPSSETPTMAGDKALYHWRADAEDLKSVLASFARANNLNIVPDNDVSGTVTLDVRGLPLQQMMRALLEASDCTWHEEGGLIRVRNVETRTFTVDYLRLSRNGKGQSSATLSSATSGGAGGGGKSGGGGQSG